jgi:hypothetical protein
MVYAPGARAAKRNGPPPDPNSLNSARRGAEWTRLPNNARDGKDAPDWPDFLLPPSMEELTFWTELWAKPQATFWARDGIYQQVAMYVRTYISSMRPGGAVTEKIAADRFAASLLLTVPALLAAKVLIINPLEETDPDSAPGTVLEHSKKQPVRSRFTIVVPSVGDEEVDENESSASED